MCSCASVTHPAVRSLSSPDQRTLHGPEDRCVCVHGVDFACILTRTLWSQHAAGPSLGSANAPLISEAGADHVIFSKKLLFIIGACVHPLRAHQSCCITAF